MASFMQAGSLPAWNDTHPFFHWAETDPEGRRANYQTFAAQFGQSPNQKKWFQNQFQAVQDKYSGQGFAHIKAGGKDPQSLDQFYQDYFASGGGAQQDWASGSPGLRGVQDSRFAPASRWSF